MKAPRPQNEADRLEALHRYEILDTAAERSFDDFTLLASTICNTPIALVSLIDEHRQWFKAKIGLEATETDRDVAFCGHAIMDTETFVVADSHQDARFVNNPLVTGSPGVRFYAGAPLVDADGHALGTLCVIDNNPRELSANEQTALEALARRVVAQLALRRASFDLADALTNVRVLEELIPICAHCKSVRSDTGYWSALEAYLERHAGTEITHSVCPTCLEEHYPRHVDKQAEDVSLPS